MSKALHLRHMLENLQNKRIKLASKSPRRQQLLQGLGLTFDVWSKEVDESYPDHLQQEEIPLYLASKKADAFREDLQDGDVLITADTIVWIDGQVLNKPEDRDDAIRMIGLLNGKTHDVYTGVSIVSLEKTELLWDRTRVHFARLTAEEIEHYIDNYSPFDKAGSYGAQDWIGLVAIDRLEGSYFNVMGLPVHKVYQALKSF
jgi:septum formation protein